MKFANASTFLSVLASTVIICPLPDANADTSKMCEAKCVVVATSERSGEKVRITELGTTFGYPVSALGAGCQVSFEWWEEKVKPTAGAGIRYSFELFDTYTVDDRNVITGDTGTSTCGPVPSV